MHHVATRSAGLRRFLSYESPLTDSNRRRSNEDGVDRQVFADVRAALSFIRCRSTNLGIDATQLVLLGEDSGALLAARAAGEHLPGVIGAVLIGGFYDPNAAGGSSPPDAISVPLLVIHGGADNESPTAQAQSYCGRVVTAGGRCQLVTVADASHRSENWWPNQWHYKQTMAEWLRTVGSPPALPHRPVTGVVQKNIPYRSSPPLALDAYVHRTSAPVPAAAWRAPCVESAFCARVSGKSRENCDAPKKVRPLISSQLAVRPASLPDTATAKVGA